MTASLNHIGIAVSDPSGLQRVRRLLEILGLGVDSTESVPDQGVNTHFVPLPLERTSLELLETVDPNGTVARFVQKRGPGVHHLSFTVGKGELEPLCAKLVSEGYRTVYPLPRPGAHRMRINFVHPASAGGILIELMEPT